MRRCRKAGASGRPTPGSSPPEAIRPFLDVLAEMLAEAVLRELRTGAALPVHPEAADSISLSARLESPTEGPLK
jgi:hypothetical protein